MDEEDLMGRIVARLAIALTTFLIGVAVCVLMTGHPSLVNHPSISEPHATSSAISPYEQGRLEAERDLRAGHLIFKLSSSIESSWSGIRAFDVKRMRERYGIEYSDAECRLLDMNSREAWIEFGDRARGYNEVMRAEIKRRYGFKL